MNFIRKTTMTTSLAITLGYLSLSNSSDASIILNYKEVGNDVVMSFDGSMNVDPSWELDAFIISSTRSHSKSTEAYILNGRFNTVDTGSMTSSVFDNLVAIETIATSDLSSSSGSIGFTTNSVTFGPSALINKTTGLISVNAANYYSIFRNQTLATLGVDAIAQNTVVWTDAATGGTFIFTSTTSVPEPSSTALLGLAALGVPLRRKR